MNTRERNEFLRQPLTAVLGTVGEKGRAYLVPNWHLRDGEAFETTGGRDSAEMRHVECRG